MREHSFEVAVLGSENTSRQMAAASPNAGELFSAAQTDEGWSEACPRVTLPALG